MRHSLVLFDNFFEVSSEKVGGTDVILSCVNPVNTLGDVINGDTLKRNKLLQLFCLFTNTNMKNDFLTVRPLNFVGKK